MKREEIGIRKGKKCKCGADGTLGRGREEVDGRTLG